MTNRELLMAVLGGEPVDRVPMWLLFPYHATSYYADVRTNPCYAEIFKRSLECCITLDRRNLGAPRFTGDVASRTEESAEDGCRITRNVVEWGDVRLGSKARLEDGRTEVTPMLRTEDDLLAWCSLPVETDADVIAPALEGQLAGYLAEKDEFPRDCGSMMLDLSEPISGLYHSSELSEYPIWSITRDGDVTGWLDREMERLRIVYKWCLERNLADVYFLVGSELASPPMVSRETFQKWIVPYARELIELIHSYGKRVIQHYHGQIAEILPDFLEMAPDGLHTIEAPPVGDCTLGGAFEVVGDRIALIGNIQYDCFRSYSAGEMKKAVRDVIEEAAGRRFILSPSAGPYEHEIAPGVIDNYLAFMEVGVEYG